MTAKQMPMTTKEMPMTAKEMPMTTKRMPVTTKAMPKTAETTSVGPVWAGLGLARDYWIPILIRCLSKNPSRLNKNQSYFLSY